jgi:glycerophosphoryl diester phosphodiesterase
MTYLFSNLSNEDGMSTDRFAAIQIFATGIVPSKRILLEDPDLVKRVHSAGLTITPYPLRSLSVPSDFTDVGSEMSYYLYDLGVDALFTDNPDLFPRRSIP